MKGDRYKSSVTEKKTKKLRGAGQSFLTGEREVSRGRYTTDRRAAHLLMLSCQRLDRAIASGDLLRAEHARADTVKKMARLMDEFGFPDIGVRIAEAAGDFGQHIIDESECLSTCEGCGERVEELQRHEGKLVCTKCIEKGGPPSKP